MITIRKRKNRPFLVIESIKQGYRYISSNLMTNNYAVNGKRLFRKIGYCDTLDSAKNVCSLGVKPDLTRLINEFNVKKLPLQ